MAEKFGKDDNMKTIVTIGRSAEWVKAQRLATGQNVEESVEVEVEVPSLSAGARTILLAAGGGRYPMRFSGRFTKNYEFLSSDMYGYYGTIPMVVDAVTPSVEEVDAAILAAAAELRERKEEDAAERAAWEAKEKAGAEAWAALPLTARAGVDGVRCCRAEDGSLASSGTVVYRHDTLKRWAAGAWDEAEAEVKRLRGEKRLKELQENLGIVCGFLGAVPQDALRGTLKALAGGEEAVKMLRMKVKGASPVVIFEDDEE